MLSIVVITRDSRTRTSVTNYLEERGYLPTGAASYDDAMESLANGEQPGALIVDVQGIPRGESGASFAGFSQWLETTYRSNPPAVIYLLRKGTRRPHFRIQGPVVKKPFPLEAVGAALRQLVGRSLKDGDQSDLDLDLKTNTVKGPNGEAHLTNIEATLLAYLMQHEGEVMHPQELLVDVWQYTDSTGANTLIRAHVSNLRRKIREVHGDDASIQTIRGKGYRFVA